MSIHTENFNHIDDNYSVATNPDLTSTQHRYLHVLFSGESQTTPSHKQGPKLYNFYLLHIIISGTGYFQTERARYKLTAGDAFLIRPHELITYESDASDPWHYVWLAFTGEYSSSIIDSSGFTANIDILSIENYDATIAHCRAIYTAFKSRQPSASMMANGYLHLLFSTFMHSQHNIMLTEASLKADHPIAKQMVHYLTTQYANPLSMDIMADSLGYNRAYISRLFKAYTGKAPRTYLLHFRLEQAKHLLRARRDLTIEQVAASVGIQDALYFSKQFKLYFKHSPSQYRSQKL